jgi:hypothetical protein
MHMMIQDATHTRKHGRPMVQREHLIMQLIPSATKGVHDEMATTKTTAVFLSATEGVGNGASIERGGHWSMVTRGAYR